MWQRRRSSGFVRKIAKEILEGLDEDEAAFEHMEEIRARAEAAELESRPAPYEVLGISVDAKQSDLTGALTVNFP